MSILNFDFSKEIQRLKKEKNAIILAHNYQISQVQEVADFIGDSLKLSRLAGETDASYIVFCGVHFMAETASIISPDKKVLIPDLEAGCSLASSINPKELLKWKNENPNAVVVSYVNTSAEIKALSDYCCTSSNAVKVVKSIPADQPVLFLPDMFLGAYVAEETKRNNIKIWPGECHVHAGITDKDINSMLAKYSNAEFMVHPECSCTSSTLYHVSKGDINKDCKILSTEGMMKEARESKNNQFLIATEVGILHRMQEENPSKEFIPVKNDAVCKYMKKITVEKVHNSLINDVYEVKVPEKIARKAIIPIERMLAIT
ncbi:quinolinate synthase NadA [Candidatus Nitrosocosmicus sp. SS]|jgi:quinolinate synthase|uniref:quinolinate synthase NadA n=1 Tax=Candidatus Nitrosocosmicus agrestis TaxID=2563600 RepID=UPI00122E3AAF|nr:quinolinate synthase NadA [Candidatus Nitrosocosmicus sp. SS]KAA2283597.1 quinolinate synthase NadA [Candidatus Nitrosocosmicus sp. SS]KAF0869679.1 quinolinate synthase NadA [Candidatus Nitrosocosmicus sp. SS]MDR4490192.1 quinolinate synthase NadA [Candidatus Nitrosocosmicus sp.]